MQGVDQGVKGLRQPDRQFVRGGIRFGCPQRLPKSANYLFSTIFKLAIAKMNERVAKESGDVIHGNKQAHH